MSPEFDRHARAISDPFVRFALPVTNTPSHSVWEVPGRRTAAKIITDDDTAERLYELFRRLGGRLRALHDYAEEPAIVSTYRLPLGPTRLAAWLENGRGTRASAGWRQVLRKQLGQTRWQKLRDMVGHLLAGDGRGVMLHGWLSLGRIIVADKENTTLPSAIVSGGEIAQGLAENDLGWIAGELLELSLIARREGRECPELNKLRDLLFSGYGTGWDPQAIASAATVRIATHARDFASYVGWRPDLHSYAPMLVDVLDSDGLIALPPTGAS